MTTVATPRGELRRSSILDATLRIIAKEGVRAVTQRRVADEANASVGLIAYHFSSTDALIGAALDSYARREGERMATLQTRIADTRGDLDLLLEVLVAEVAGRSHELREDALAGFALTLEIPRLTLDRESFEAWEAGQEALYSALLSALGHESTPGLVSYLGATFDGLYLYAVISADPGAVLEAARAGLGMVLQTLAASPAGVAGP